MNLRFTLTILIVFIFTVTQSKAQDSSFQLKDYKFRTQLVQGLLIDFNLSGAISDVKAINSNDAQRRSFNTSPFLEHFRVISTEKRQHISNFGLRPSYNSSFNSSDTPRTKNRSAMFFGGYSRMDRFFFKRNTFFEIGNEFNTYGYSSRQSGGNTFSNSGIINFQDRLTVGVGKGRLENVQDAQMALFIVNDLKKMNLLDQDMSAGKVNELAQLITGINNRRVFDSRIRRIYELTKIDSFFRANQLVKQSSIAFFTTVNDNWALAFNPGRLAGTMYYFRMRPSVTWNRNVNEQDLPTNNYKGTNRIFTYAYEPVIGVEKQQPLNLFWQKSMGASLSFVQEWQRNKSQYRSGTNSSQQPIFFNSAGSGFVIDAFYAIGYYPNNRTMVNASFNMQSQYVFSNFSGKSPGLSLSPGLNLTANYFINYRTRVTVNAGALYQYYDAIIMQSPSYIYRTSSVDANINIGFSHILF